MVIPLKQTLNVEMAPMCQCTWLSHHPICHLWTQPQASDFWFQKQQIPKIRKNWKGIKLQDKTLLSHPHKNSQYQHCTLSFSWKKKMPALLRYNWWRKSLHIYNVYILMSLDIRIHCETRATVEVTHSQHPPKLPVCMLPFRSVFFLQFSKVEIIFTYVFLILHFY